MFKLYLSVRNRFKQKNKSMSYITINILLHVYIILLIYIVVLSREALSQSVYATIYFLVPFKQLYNFIIVFSLYFFILIELSFSLSIRKAKFDELDKFFQQNIPKKLQISLHLKGGIKLIGYLSELDIHSLRMMDLENVIYDIKYKEIQILGCKYCSSDSK